MRHMVASRFSRSRQSGFTILEVLVSFVVASLLLSVILSSFSQGLSNLVRVDTRAQAALVAQSRLAEVGVLAPLQAGALRGVEVGAQEFHWTVSVAPLDWEYAGRLVEMGAVLYRVDVTVTWGEGRSANSFGLSTLRTFRESPNES